MTIRSRFSETLVRQRFVQRCDCIDGQWDELWNDLRLHGTLESMWIVSVRTTQGDKQIRAGAQKCATTASGTVLRQAQQHSGSIGLIHTSSSLKHVDFLK